MVPALGMLYPFFPRGSRDITPCEKKKRHRIHILSHCNDEIICNILILKTYTKTMRHEIKCRWQRSSMTAVVFHFCSKTQMKSAYLY